MPMRRNVRKVLAKRDMIMRKLVVGCAALLAALGASPSFASPPELLAKGEYLARAGDCVVCHTGPGEKPFAGGLKMSTPQFAVKSASARSSPAAAGASLAPSI